nr:LysM domain-containing protein [Methylomarinum sp. Ch1-1]MDP4520968.1 LysM domain-containing protein [Methylomarinum sp. Ch1-1]
MNRCRVRTISLIVTVLLLAGCAGAGNYAPVRSYYRDIPKAQKYYTVKKGDTLYAIGFRSGHGYRRLAAWNKLSPPYRIFVGQKIKLFKSKQKLRTSKKNLQLIGESQKREIHHKKT